MNDWPSPELMLRFQIRGTPVSMVPYGNGHIHRTFLGTSMLPDGTCKRYILQAINRYVFRDIEGLMRNIIRVSRELRRKSSAMPEDELQRRILFPIPLNNEPERFFCELDHGETWRCYHFIENSITLESCETAQIAFEAARAFARFSANLSELATGALQETIPDFHNTAQRYRNFLEAEAMADATRRELAAPEIAEVHRLAWLADALPRERLPLRVTHNDTKINNILFDAQTKQALCVIDLDTVMPGLVAYDCGDLIRTTVSTEPEDTCDTDAIEIRPDVYRAVLDGYEEGMGSLLTETERESLPLGAMVITFETAMRFLEDFLRGNRYFRVDHPTHNLQRCRAQLTLVKRLSEFSR